MPFVAFRDEEGAAHVLADTCVHRGSSLSAGSVRDGCVICPYHGWQYGGDGKCVKVPSAQLAAAEPRLGLGPKRRIICIGRHPLADARAFR